MEQPAVQVIKEGDWVTATVKKCVDGVMTTSDVTVEIVKRDGNRLRVKVDGEEETKWIESSAVIEKLDKEAMLALWLARNAAIGCIVSAPPSPDARVQV